MSDFIKTFIKKRPRLFDFLAGVHSSLTLKKDDAYKLFDNFSRAHGRCVTFVQIGASDGLRWDPLWLFVVRDGWDCILVEPLPAAFEILKSNYRHVKRSKLAFVNAAVSSASGGSLPSWTLNESFLNGLSVEEQVICLQKSSFDKEHLLRWARLAGHPETILKEINVPRLTVSELVRRYWDGRPVNLLVIDAEGHEPEIPRGVDFQTTAPEAIFFESHNLGSRKGHVYELLLGESYEIYEMGGDSVAVQKTIDLARGLRLKRRVVAEPTKGHRVIKRGVKGEITRT